VGVGEELLGGRGAVLEALLVGDTVLVMVLEGVVVEDEVMLPV